MKKRILLLLGCAISLIACSTEDSSTNLTTPEINSESSTTTYSTNSTSDFWEDFLRFDWYRKSRYCESGFGICTMQDKRDIIEERKRLEELEGQHDYGIYQSNSIVTPMDPVDDFEGGVLDVIYDRAQLLATGELQLNIHLANAPSSTPVPLMVEETLSMDIDGTIFNLQAGNYEYIPTMGTYGGYTITISN